MAKRKKKKNINKNQNRINEQKAIEVKKESIKEDFWDDNRYFIENSKAIENELEIRKEKKTLKKYKNIEKKLIICLTVIVILLLIGCTSFFLTPRGSKMLTRNFVKITRTLKITKDTYKLDLKSAYGDNEGYHPKVIALEKPWHGYYYWIAFTPYPKADQGKENPHILASNDMIKWEEPLGYENPLDPAPDGPSKLYYNSDTHLLYNEKLDRMECYWRYVDDVTHIVIIYRKYTYDGVTWSEKEEFLKANRRKRDYLSPVVIIEDDKYKVWYVDRDLSLRYIERNVDDEAWSEPRKIVVDFAGESLHNWHLDLIRTDKGYEMLLSAFYKSHNTMNLYYLTSTDNIKYTPAKKVLAPELFSWNNKGLYRSSILYYQGNYFIFYSGIGYDGTRGVGITYGKTIDSIIWLTENNLYDFKKLVSKTACYE